jgi:hypothetical protein
MSFSFLLISQGIPPSPLSPELSGVKRKGKNSLDIQPSSTQVQEYGAV